MHATRFDDFLRALPEASPRRGVLRGLVVLALTAFGLPNAVEAKKKRKKRKNKKKVKRNDFGCVNAGGFCKNSGQCCSGICQGKKGRKKCKAHDDSTCQADQDFCAGDMTVCTTSTGSLGTCFRTTGNASYCSTTPWCVDCTKDADCVPYCGAGAACIACGAGCASEGFQTHCAGTNENSCGI